MTCKQLQTNTYTLTRHNTYTHSPIDAFAYTSLLSFLLLYHYHYYYYYHSYYSTIIIVIVIITAVLYL